MQRGQLSIDLIFAIIVALMFIQVVFGAGEAVQESNAITAVLMQEKRIATEIESFLIASKALDVPGASLSSSFRTGRILTPYTAGWQDCDITYYAGTGEILVEYTITTDDGTIFVDHTQEISMPASTEIDPSSLNGCNQVLVVGNA